MTPDVKFKDFKIIFYEFEDKNNMRNSRFSHKFYTNASRV
jgi:hypothetical protein